MTHATENIKIIWTDKKTGERKTVYDKDLALSELWRFAQVIKLGEKEMSERESIIEDIGAYYERN